MNQVKTMTFLKPKPDEIIILYFEEDEIDLERLNIIYQDIVKLFPENKVIALNKKLNLTKMQKDSLIELLQS